MSRSTVILTTLSGLSHMPHLFSVVPDLSSTNQRLSYNFMLCFLVLTATRSAAANPPSPLEKPTHNLTYRALGNEYLMSRTHVYQARNDLLPAPASRADSSFISI